MDVLSRILDLVTVESTVSTRLEASGEWALRFPRVVHIKFGAVEHGEAWLGTGGEWRRLSAGDCFVIATDQPYFVASDPSLEPVDGLPLFRRSTDGVARIGEGQGAAICGGRFVLDESSSRLLLDVLPPMLVVPARGPEASSLRATLELFSRETREPRAGSAVVASHLGPVVFVEAIRIAMNDRSAELRGWLGALRDERIGAAIHLMYEEPARRWTVPALAEAVHMSRSSFAARFKDLVGSSPLEHLLMLRMQIAARALRDESDTISSIGAGLGYTSDAAFSSAFKRVVGVPPREWRRDARPASTEDVTDARALRLGAA
ncbi:MAG: cupin domain-containing protein [Solirubrobacterales bacterium]